jgi:hypothetical protein
MTSKKDIKGLIIIVAEMWDIIVCDIEKKGEMHKRDIISNIRLKR